MITNTQAQSAINNLKNVFNRDGEVGLLTAVTKLGYHWTRLSDREKFTFPGRIKCDWLSLGRTVYVIHREDSEPGMYSQDPDFSLEYDTRTECLVVIRELRSWQPKVKRRCIELIRTD